MFKSSQHNKSRRAPARSMSRPTPPRGRLARPGRPPRRSGPNLGRAITWILLLIVVAIGAFLFWQSGRTQRAEEAAFAATPDALSSSAELTASAVESTTPTITASPAPPIVSSGAVPGAGSVGEVVTAAPVAAGMTPRPPGSTPASRMEDLPTPGATLPVPAVARTSAVPTPAAKSTVAVPSPAATVAPVAARAMPNRPGEVDFDALAQRMLARVNADRAANGLEPVAWDETAARAGQLHAEEMARFGYMSHWNMDGYGPDYRYSRAGGQDFSQENVYRLLHQWEGGGGAPIDDWEKVIDDAQSALMNSPGHRANILTPGHTHLGVGIAYNPASGNATIAQEFVNRYVMIEPLPRRGRPGDRIVLRGTLLEGSEDPLVNIAYELFPSPMSLDQLNRTSTYTSAAELLSVAPVVVGNDRRFVSEFTLDKAAAPGLYHVLLWVEAAGEPERVPAVDAIIEVNE